VSRDRKAAEGVGLSRSAPEALNDHSRREDAAPFSAETIRPFVAKVVDRRFGEGVTEQSPIHVSAGE
jgi:hypothetical protein